MHTFSVPLVAFLICSACGKDADDSSNPDDTAPAEDTPPEWCESSIPGGLHHVMTHPTAPYWIHHPFEASDDVPTVVFLPGGPGTDPTGEGTYRMFLERGTDVKKFRVVIVTATDEDLTDEWDRVPVVTDEVLACYGGDRDRVHIAGTSNGGLGAFSIMLTAYERYATLLGCPGLWESWDETAITTALAGRSVFNGVGELDAGWKSGVQQTHEQLLDLGVDSVYVEFPKQGHIPDETFDPDALFAFWSAH
ncbi:MAG: hypothetical protein JXB39_16285 [Deltaproteobacteria bacterium]|nr:hypothetical protein [Deltaproteobacteria bacterium]